MSEKTNQLRLGIPKGSLQDTTQKLFVRAGYDLARLFDELIEILRVHSATAVIVSLRP